MFKIIIITPETNHPQEEQILHALVRAHGITIHVRKPDFTELEYKSYLSRYASIFSHMVLHEHHSLAKEFSVKGIHLKEVDRNSAKEIDKNVNVISTSFHTIEDIKNNLREFEYIFYSPLFKSISKENYGTNTTEEQLAETLSALKKQTNIPIIGLGGINEENIALVKKCGFDGAAVLGSVWQQSNPVESFHRIFTSVQ